MEWAATLFIFSFLFYAFYRRMKSVRTALLFILFDYIIYVISSNICNIIVLDMLKVSNSFIIFSSSAVLIAASSLVVGKIYAAGYKAYNRGENVNQLGSTGLFLFANISMLLSCIYIILISFKNTAKSDILFVNICLILVYCSISFFSYKLYFGNMKKEMEKRNMENEMEQLKAYTESLEDITGNMRKFKHDYINILLTMDGYLEENKYEELKKFFYSDIYTYSEDLKNQNTRLSLLSRIKISPLKGLVSSKILNACSKNMDAHIDIVDDISRIDMHILDLCRIVGILLDNAVEGALEAEEHRLQFGIIKRKASVVILINNSCKDDMPPIYKLYEKGFSTKGDNRGFGLFNCRDIIDKKYGNTTLNTEIDTVNRMFRQELCIRYTESE